MCVPVCVCMSVYRDINPDVQFEINNYNITLIDNFTHFMEILKYGHNYICCSLFLHLSQMYSVADMVL